MDEGFDIERKLKGKQKGGRLENWKCINYAFKKTYLDDDLRLCGYIYDDPRFIDGERITTSPIISVHDDVGIAETLNSYYVLGKRAKDRDDQLII